MELRHIASRAGRLSSFLREEMGMSAGLVNRLKWQEKLFVNGTAQFTNYAVVPGDVITISIDEPVPDYPAQEGCLSVLYEDAHFLAVDKPAGMLIHPSRHCNTGTLAKRMPNSVSVLSPIHAISMVPVIRPRNALRLEAS